MAIVLIAGLAGCATPQTLPTATPVSADTSQAAVLKERCADLIAFFDRYGTSRSANSDGPRNHTRINALISCQRGQYAKGIATMEGLLKRKAFTVPPPETHFDEPQDI